MPTRGEERVRGMRKELETKLAQTTLFVVLLGSGGAGLDERRSCARSLRARGIVAIIPEDDFPGEVGPSVVEPHVLAQSDVDLVFLRVESLGSASELGEFHTKPSIAAKLCVLVDPDHHPFHAPRKGYVMDQYLTHLAAFGRVYAVDRGRLARVPTAEDVIGLLSDRFRLIKALSVGITK